MFRPNKAIKNAQSELKILSWVLDVKLQTNDISQQQKVTCGLIVCISRLLVEKILGNYYNEEISLAVT